MKTCVKCKIEKELTEFYKAGGRKKGRDNTCGGCRSERRMVRYFNEQGKSKEIENAKRDRTLLDKKLKELKLRLKKKRKETHYKCQICKVWFLGERRRCKPCHNSYHKERNKNPIGKLSNGLRSRMYMAFKAKSWRKGGSTEALLGCSWEVAHKHLERQFTEGMTWGNHGEWHIDHIIPLSIATNKEELERLCHYTNLQPLWAFDNISKNNKIVEHQIKLRI